MKTVKYGFLFALLLISKSVLSHDTDDDNRLTTLIPVPNGFQPEGVVKGRGHMAYVGSLLTGGIYQVNLVSGEGNLLVASAPGAAVGLAFDKRSNFIFVAGGLQGTVRVYDSSNGSEQAVYNVTEPGTFINDGIITRNAAYFTDSFAPVIYRIPLSKNGQLPDADNIETINLSGDFEFVPGEFNGNGIEAPWNGKMVYVVSSVVGQLYQINPKTGIASKVTIKNGDVTSGDGLLFYEDRLYVVQNFLNQIAELKLSDDGLTAEITNIITDSEFRVPTTVTGFGDSLFAINARFDVAPPPFPGYPPADPDLTYNLVKVKIDD